MSDPNPVAPSPQPSLGPYPVPGNSPQPYLTGPQAQLMLQQRWPRFSGVLLGDGDMLVASMALDEEAPFMGVKVNPEQDRQWPRSFRFGWPNVIAAPSPLLVSRSFAGAWYLDYEGVVPQHILDWVCLEAYRQVSLDQLKVVTQETIAGASVKYAPAEDYARGQAPQLDRIQQTLLAPWLQRGGHTVPFISWSNL